MGREKNKPKKVPMDAQETVQIEPQKTKEKAEKETKEQSTSLSNPEPYQSIPQLFKGKCVMVTGATGFLGKVLVEKLLRSCPGLRELYILQRPSGGSRGEKEIYENYIGQRVFERLRNEGLDYLHKIRILTGDITKVNLGLSESQYSMVIRNVCFVFHCAANVRFEDLPRNTMMTNLLGVKNILDICKSCENFEALVHVSTAYSFCNQSIIDEKIYPEGANPARILETLCWASNCQLRDICMNYIQSRPSIYHFSKAMAEILIVQSSSVPTIIVRPSIITASVEEPFPGWIDNHNGPSGFIAVCGKAIVRTLLVEEDVYADWVPVDIVANTLIVAAHYMAVKSKIKEPSLMLNPTSGVPIINCTCPENNRITWSKAIEICLPYLIQYPSMHVCGKPGGIVTACPLLYNMCRLTSHYIPAVLIDGARLLAFKKPQMIPLYKNIHRVMGYLEHYTTHSYYFQSLNMQLLTQQMSSEDRKLFPIDQGTLNWRIYIKNYVLGVRRFYMRECDGTLPDARIRMMKIHYAWMALKLSSMFGLLLLIYTLQTRGFPSRSLLPSFTYLNSAMGYIHCKIVFPLM